MTATARDLTKAVVVEQPAQAYRMCPYCGTPCRGRSCIRHRDLVLIEYGLEHGLYAQSNETAASLDPGAATVSQPKGV